MSITLVFDLSRFAKERPRTGGSPRAVVKWHERLLPQESSVRHVVTSVLLVIPLFQEIGDGAVGPW